MSTPILFIQGPPHQDMTQAQFSGTILPKGKGTNMRLTVCEALTRQGQSTTLQALQ